MLSTKSLDLYKGTLRALQLPSFQICLEKKNIRIECLFETTCTLYEHTIAVYKDPHDAPPCLAIVQD